MSCDLMSIVRDGEPIAGGAFLSPDDTMVESNRIWTRPDLRCRGLAKRVVRAREDEAVRLGDARAT